MYDSLIHLAKLKGQNYLKFGNYMYNNDIIPIMINH